MAESPVLAVEDLTSVPGDAESPVFRGLSFAVARGDRTVLTGPSGAGKSTLLRCMVLLEPAAGRILLDGEAVVSERVRELRRRVGYLPQRPVAIADRVAENLSFPRELGAGLGESEQRALLERMGVGDVPGTRRFDALSGGEQQRVALVRTLTTRPEVLLLDEPTASLDPENVDAVTDLLSDWLDEDPMRAMVWVSHHAYQVEGLATRRVGIRELSP